MKWDWPGDLLRIYEGIYWGIDVQGRGIHVHRGLAYKEIDVQRGFAYREDWLTGRLTYREITMGLTSELIMWLTYRGIVGVHGDWRTWGLAYMGIDVQGHWRTGILTMGLTCGLAYMRISTQWDCHTGGLPYR